MSVASAGFMHRLIISTQISVVVEPTPFTHVSGYSNRYQEMLNYLSLAGDEVSVMCPDDTPNPPKEYKGYTLWLVALYIAFLWCYTQYPCSELSGVPKSCFPGVNKVPMSELRVVFRRETKSTCVHVYTSVLFPAEFHVCVFFV